jgi:hypothetical protein
MTTAAGPHYKESLIENFPLCADGVYQIEVRGFLNASSGAYTLVIEASREPATPTASPL